jgi:hypothetical protein
MDKSEKMYSLLINNHIVDNLNLSEIEELLMQGQVNLGCTQMWKSNMEERNTIHHFYVINNIEIPDKLKKMFLFQNIISNLDTTCKYLDFMRDDTYDKNLLIEDHKKGIESVDSIKYLIEELYNCK